VTALRGSVPRDNEKESVEPSSVTNRLTGAYRFRAGCGFFVGLGVGTGDGVGLGRPLGAGDGFGPGRGDGGVDGAGEGRIVGTGDGSRVGTFFSNKKITINF
jgi:hypothetical protein